MATNVTFNGTTYSVPAYGNEGWAQGPGNLSSYLVAIASGCLQTTGGTFTLSADVNFGATYGLFAAYFTSASPSPATAGVVRLAQTDQICFGTGNTALTTDGGNGLLWNGNYLAQLGNEKYEVYIAGTPLNNYTGSLTVIAMVSTYATGANNLDVFVNGLRQDITLDYAETTNASITFNAPLNTGDRISLRWIQY